MRAATSRSLGLIMQTGKFKALQVVDQKNGSRVEKIGVKCKTDGARPKGLVKALFLP